MSKEDGCKVASVCKHKERKPKKPHYIPRPWGKPYNYKCFQCPFTCMEKSHLYNHMKYSLCKNSLSLLIESDWPYKKGNILHPEQLRPLQHAHGLHKPQKEDQGQGTEPEERPRQGGPLDEEEEDPESRGGGGGGEEEEAGGGGDGAELTGLAKENSGRSQGLTQGTKHPVSRQESELLMADMFSLEDQLLRARSVEVEAQLKQYKLSKTCLTAPGLLSEHWRLLTMSHTKAKAEGVQSRMGGSIPCYPPPPNLLDYQDPTGLNLSLLGVGYPISPSLFSYMNAAAAAPGLNTPTHAQMADQLPFLASAAQLIHPSSGLHAHPDRTLLAPRLFYPFLCEHSLGATAFGNGDTSKGMKTPAGSTSSSGLAGRLPSYPPKVNLWKVPAVRPGAHPSSPQAGWVSPQREGPDPGFRPGEKLTSAAREGRTGWGLKRPGALQGMSEAPVEKRPAVGFGLEVMKNIQNSSSPADRLLMHSSSQGAQLVSRPVEAWQDDTPPGPNMEPSSRAGCGEDPRPDRTTGRTAGPVAGPSQSVAGLLNDLSKALQEYQEAERKISHLDKDDLPAQGHLWEHLSTIRSELFHIHRALEQTAAHNEGPLDLSVKREPDDAPANHSSADDGDHTKDISPETEEEEDDAEQKEEEEEEEEDGAIESERKAIKASLECRTKSLDMLIKMSQACVPALSGQAGGAPGGFGLRPGPAEVLWPGRTTKCEADSSVLLCPDGRPLVSHIAPCSALTPKRPPSQQRPPSPLNATDS
ncbi:proline-rich protein 35 [Gadus macrocephalus]|nr:proline-rich protein 35 [Gadus macrocephalus]